MPDTSLQGAFALDFPEQIEFFRQKIEKASKRWNLLSDGTPIEGAMHDTTFIVAGAMKADLLDDLRQAVDKAIEKGTGLTEFRKDFRRIVSERGWHGWTGEGTKAGVAWRTRVIWETNLATSYAAGRHAQLTDPELLARRPYWKYIHSESVLHPRPQHLAWDGLVLRHDDPFWQTHFPPNGWGCQCRLMAVRAPGEGDKTKPPKGWDAPDEKGRLPGIDRGWNYAPGASVADDLRKIVAEKAAKLPEELAAPFLEEANAILQPPVFEPQKTAKAAAEWAVKHNLADHADYTGIKPEVANAWNKSLFEHLQDFPELRKNQAFVGTAQAQLRLDTVVRRARIVKEAVKNGIPVATAEQWAAHLIKVPKMKGNAYAQSMHGDGAPGVSVNLKFGKNPAAFTKTLESDVKTGWHPVGCDTIRSVVDHEFGHQLDDLLGVSLDPRVKILYKESMAQGMRKSVSGYAATNINEFIAECWAECLNNPSPRPTAKAIGNIIRNRYGQRYP